MNPQYMPPQQFRGSPQVFPGQAPPPAGQQSFQNIPLDATNKPGPQNIPTSLPPTSNFAPPLSNNGVPSSVSPPGQYPPNLGPPSSMRPIPSSQLPPGADQRPPSRPQSNQFAPPPKAGDNFPPPSQFQNGFQNGPGFTQPPNSLSGNPPMKPPVSSMNPPNIPGKPPLGQQNNMPPSQTQPPFPGGQPLSGQPPTSFTGQPPMPQLNQSHMPQMNQPPMPPLNQPSMPPLNQPPMPQLNQSPMPQLNQPPMPQLNQPPMPQLNQPPMPQLNQPPMSQLNQPPIQGQSPLTGPPPLGQTQGPPIQNQGPPPIGQPPMPGQPPMSGQPPMLGQLPRPGQPPLTGNKPPNIPGNQFAPGPGNNQFAQPPMPGQPPMPNQYPGQPPMPGQQFAGGPPGPYNPNQLSNQMQGMNLGASRQYPGGPMKNGDPGPHMPPPMNQQQQPFNGQQMRGPQQPGYPPMPGQGGMPPAPAGYPQPAYQQQQQNRQRLDPDQMPNPIQVTQDDQQNRSGLFYTNQKGQVPPLVTTNFVVNDGGNASPRFIRSTMYNVPVSQDIMKNTAVPFSLVISPMARTLEQEHPPPIVNFGELGPVRCIRCKAYMCPFMQFIDSGRRFQCLFCKATTDVPTEYFQHLDHTGQRMDRFERPELVLGTYEFVATADYCRNNVLPKPPAIIFVIDVSYNNIKSGLVNLLCAQMKDIIQNLPLDQGQEKSNMKVGFITYNSSVHFYNIKGSLAAPQMMVVGDIQEMFMPLLDGFLCTPEESEAVIDALMQQIPAMFADTRETETVLLPAILAGLEALKASECAGKLLVFHSSLPTSEAPGKLRNREDRKLLGTEKERTILTPQTQAYNQLGQDCVGVGCSVDLFIFNNSYIDIATIGQVSRLTGGEVFKYTYFQADLDGERVIKDIITNINRPIAFDAIMRVRTSTGVRPTDFYGHFFMSNTTDMELAAIDCDKAVAVEIKHDDKLAEDEGVYIQAALLFTSCSGQRRLRIINLSLKTVSQMADLYRSCDLDTILNFIAKQSAFKLLDNSPKAVKDAIVNRAAQILATYRKNCASPSSAGQLILPECMKLLPLYVNCLLKNDAISGGADMTIDDRSFVMQAMMTMDIQTSVYYFYPRLIPVHDIEPSNDIQVPPQIRCSIEKMSDQGVYILENGIHMFLWIGLGANPEFIQKVFGVQSAIQVDVDRIALPELDNPLSLAVRTIIEEIRIQKHRCMRLTLVRQREKLEPVFKHFLVEDRSNDGSPSYVDFLCHMHKEIRALLS